MERIVDWKVVTVSPPEQLAVRFKLESGGWTPLTRLRYAGGRRIPPGADDIDVRRSILAILQDRLEHGTMIPQQSKFTSCADAMLKYIPEHRARHSRDKSFENHAAAFVEFFKTTPLQSLNSKAAQQFIEHLIGRGYAYDTVRLRVAAASTMISWLERNGNWHTRNPFTGMLKQYDHRFKAAPPVKSTISDDEIAALLGHAQGDRFKPVRVYVEIARCTGLRVEEIKALDTALLDRDKAIWNVYVTKTRGRRLFRQIAIPRRLIVYLANEGVNGRMKLSKFEHLFREARRAAGLPDDFTLKTFRKDFAHRMESVGTSPDLINLHQGRAQTGVLFQNYLTDPGRAARLCRSYINAMFGETPEMVRVK